MDELLQARADYLANSDYSVANSTTKANAFIVACRNILLLQPTLSREEGTEAQFRTETLRESMRDAEAWLAANQQGLGSAIRYACQRYVRF